MDASRRWGDGQNDGDHGPDVVRGARRSLSLGRRPARGRSVRRRSCEADRGHAPAVATIRLSDAGSSWEVAVCAHHLAAFEAELGGWGVAG